MVGSGPSRSLARRARRIPPVLLVLVVLVPMALLPGALPATPAHAAGAAAGDEFYVPPNPLPPGSPGDVIRSRRSVAPLTTASAWQLLYRSTTALGEPTAVSGTLLVPAAPFSGTRPVVASTTDREWAHAPGTQGWGDQCAPSKSIAGGAADWAAQLQPSYAPELRLTGVAGGGTPANLQAVARNINGTAFFAFLAGTAIGFNAAYPSLNLNQYLTAQGQEAMRQLNTQCQVTALLQFAGKRIEDYTVGHVNPVDLPPVKAVLDLNNLGGTRPAAPVLQYHGLLDQIIPYQVEANLHRQYCAMGVTTQLNAYAGDHVLTHVLAQGDVVSWLRARLAGTPARRNC
jgi:hypothetical protein